MVGQTEKLENLPMTPELPVIRAQRSEQAIITATHGARIRHETRPLRNPVSPRRRRHGCLLNTRNVYHLPMAKKAQAGRHHRELRYAWRLHSMRTGQSGSMSEIGIFRQGCDSHSIDGTRMGNRGQRLLPISHGPSTASACCGPGGTKPIGI